MIWIASLRYACISLGVEFLMSTQAFYCSLCDVFLGSCTCAETHCKSDDHNDKYAVSTALLRTFRN